MELLNGENQIPVFAPNYIPVFELEGVEEALIQVFVILWMGVTPDEVTNVHHFRGIVVEEQVHRQVPCRFCFQNVQSSHLLQLFIDSCGFHLTFVNKEIHPFSDNILSIHLNKSNCS